MLFFLFTTGSIIVIACFSTGTEQKYTCVAVFHIFSFLNLFTSGAQFIHTGTRRCRCFYNPLHPFGGGFAISEAIMVTVMAQVAGSKHSTLPGLAIPYILTVSSSHGEHQGLDFGNLSV